MAQFVRLLPGLIAAVAAFVAARILDLFTFLSLFGETIVFVALYVVFAVAVDRALIAYGRREP